MKNTFFKRTAVAIALSSSFFALTANAALVPFESAQTNQIEGFYPIFPSIGAAIVKQGETTPYAASGNGNVKTTVKVGDKLFVPIGVEDAIRSANQDALAKGVYQFFDLDGDAESAPKMISKVEWFVVPAGTTDLSTFTPVTTTESEEAYGVPYTVQLKDAGKQIGFKVTPLTILGIPDEGYAVTVPNVSLLSGQAYPDVTDPTQPAPDTDGNGIPEGPDGVNPDKTVPPVAIVPVDPEKPGVENPDNPNIGGEGIVDSPYAKYRVTIVNANGDAMTTVDSGPTAQIAYVNTAYSVKIEQLAQDADGDIQLNGTEALYNEVTGEAKTALENNIVWKLYDGTTELVNTGLSANATGDAAELAALKAAGGLDAKALDTASITGRLSNGTLTFKTQVNNEGALDNTGAQGSEQGLTIKAILVADDKLDATPAVAQ